MGRALIIFGSGRGRIVLVVLLVLRWIPVAADEVVLKTGGTVLGKAYREDGQVRVELETGTVAFPESWVERVIPGISPAEIKARLREERRARLESRLSEVAATDAQGIYRIAEDAWSGGFPEEEVRFILGLVLGADPDHAGARADLGEVLYRGQWVTRDEARRLEARDHAEGMRARGFIEFRGEWMRPEEVDWQRHEREWEERTRRLEDELEYARSELRDREYEASGLEDRNSELETALISARDETQELEGRIDDLERRLAVLRAKLHRCADEWTVCRNELASIPRPVCEPEQGRGDRNDSMTLEISVGAVANRGEAAGTGTIP